ncbi:PAS domain S-box protein [Leptospira kanakyensis]|uniref:Response regulator n=1 Tax=Leptospira kanakyensis TaxID=2484968 RepID=A0A6N4PWI9_9LEPT|nr:PAS domain S-box protein [Leptospira kanakyensis]MCW7468082.1 PAS domain S-box protein [Leptospira kanakyensis]TGK49285.1 response regulator [Leptospira kanakyensis]TGK60474.1 response regulator [Leptospira kanakyensis]TGK67873.1 response regulator [Leptospira kanakyensis]
MTSVADKSILLVEDEAILAMFEKKQLEDGGYSVTHVNNGENAIQLIIQADKPFDLILMDIDLGKGLDGTQTATEILNHKEIPVVFLSSHTEREIVKKTESITSYGYVVKNSGFTVLDASIKMAFKLFEANELTKSKKEHLETVLHSIGDGVIATDSDGKVIRMNPIAEKLTGWTHDEGVGLDIKDVFKIVNVKTRALVENPVDIVLRTNSIVGLANHTVLLSRDGSEYQISDSGSPIKDLNGETRGVVLVFRDITAEYNVQSHIAKQANMLNNVLDAVIGTDFNHKINYWNKAAEKIYLWKSEEVIGKSVMEVLKTDYINLSSEQVMQRVNLDGSFIGEVIQYAKDGSIRNIEVNQVLLDDESDLPIGYIAVGRDISDRLNALRRVKESEAKLTEIIESAMDAIISIDQSKKIILFNGAAEKMFGYQSLEIIGQPLDQLIPINFRSQHDNNIDSFSKTGVSRRAMGALGEIRGLRSNGEEFPIEASISQISVKEEKLYTVILRDVSVRNLSESKIQKLLLEKENILKEIHHRVKNNMSSIFTLLTLQARAQSESSVQTILYEAAGRVKSMIVLYDKLYHSETDNTVSLQDYFPAIFNEIVSIFPKSVEVKMNILEEPIELNAKLLSSLGIILNELITNSMKHAFNEINHAVIGLKIFREDKKLYLEYSDNGLGIPESVSFENSPGFGLQLIGMLVDQIEGKISIVRQPSSIFLLEFAV